MSVFLSESVHVRKQKLFVCVSIGKCALQKIKTICLCFYLEVCTSESQNYLSVFLSESVLFRKLKLFVCVSISRLVNLKAKRTCLYFYAKVSMSENLSKSAYLGKKNTCFYAKVSKRKKEKPKKAKRTCPCFCPKVSKATSPKARFCFCSKRKSVITPKHFRQSKQFVFYPRVNK